MHSTTTRLTVLSRLSYNIVVRISAWLASRCASSRVEPFSNALVIPVPRKVWQQMSGSRTSEGRTRLGEQWACLGSLVLAVLMQIWQFSAGSDVVTFPCRDSQRRRSRIACSRTVFRLLRGIECFHLALNWLGESTLTLVPIYLHSAFNTLVD